MIKILLFGTGSSAEKVLLNIRKDKAEITGCLDNDKKKQGSTYNGIKVYAPYELKKLEYDFIIIASVKYGLITEQLAGLGVREGSIIPYFKFDHSEYKKYKSFLYTDGMVYDELYKKYEDLDIYVHEMEYAVADKLNKGKIQLPDIMSIDDTIENIISTFKLKVESYGGKIEADLRAENALVEVDEMHFTNVIFNLLDNAVKYRREDEPLRLTVSTADVGGDKLEIRISDNGIGIKREDLKKIFEKFYRVSTGNRHDVKGFGLGLAYVHKMVRELNGTIRAESDFGHGTTFIINLPLTTIN